MQKTDITFWLKEKLGWILIVVFSCIPVLIFLAVNDVNELFYDTRETLKTIGLVTGLVGFVLYAINMLLAIRKPWLENFFNGLNQVYIAHHITGGIALCLVLFHPLLLAVQYIDLGSLSSLKNAAVFLLPDTFNSQSTLEFAQEVTAFNSGIIAFIGMVVLLILTFFVKLPYSFWLFTHKFLGVAFLFAGIHVLFINSDVSDSLLLTIYMAVWILIGLGAFVYRTLLGNVLIRRAPYEVKSVAFFEKDVMGIYLAPLEKNIDFKPGQFVYVRFLWSGKDGIVDETHPFSVATNPGIDGMVLYIKALGDFTTNLRNLKVGTVAEIEGAFGKFSYRNFSSSPQVWIGAGIGITPFISMARDYSLYAPPVDLYYTAQTRSELIEQGVLAQYLPETYQNFRYFPFVSQEAQTHLTAEHILQQSGNLQEKEFFICGPPLMMKSMRSQLRKMGVKRSKIHTEEFSMS